VIQYDPVQYDTTSETTVSYSKLQSNVEATETILSASAVRSTDRIEVQSDAKSSPEVFSETGVMGDAKGQESDGVWSAGLIAAMFVMMANVVFLFVLLLLKENNYAIMEAKKKQQVANPQGDHAQDHK
jgi:hypothetical protein